MFDQATRKGCVGKQNKESSAKDEGVSMQRRKDWQVGRLLLLLFLVVLVGCTTPPPALTPTPKPTPTATTPPETSEPAPQALAGTNWMLVELNGKTDKAVQGVTANFNNAQLVGLAGCNSYAADYKMDTTAITVTAVVTTSANSCTPEAIALESEYLATLGQAKSYHVQGVDLQFNDAAGSAILRYRALPAMQLSGSTWTLTAYQNDAGQLTDVLPTPVVTAIFTEGALNGYGGCSNYEGRYTLVGTAITITEVKRVAVVSSSPTCGEGGDLRGQEDAYLAALPKAQTAAIA